MCRASNDEKERPAFKRHDVLGLQAKVEIVERVLLDRPYVGLSLIRRAP